MDDALFQELVDTCGLDRADYDLRLVQKILIEYLQGQHIPHLDLLEDYRSRGRGKRLYLLQDTHWKGHGATLAAKLLVNYLRPRTDACLGPGGGG